MENVSGFGVATHPANKQTRNSFHHANRVRHLVRSSQLNSSSTLYERALASFC
jgi:hypothetical protein